MSDLLNELNIVLNFFALVDQCQNQKLSTLYAIEVMPKMDRVIKDELDHKESKVLFERCEKIFLGGNK